MEIYAREFKVQDGFKLVLSLHYLCTKLVATRKQLIIKALNFCSEKGKWDVSYEGKNVVIYIHKFKKYLDETTLKKLRLAEQNSGMNPESIRNESGIVPPNVRTEVDVDVDNNTPPTPPGGAAPKNGYSKSFLDWYEHYPKKVAKDKAYEAWRSIGKKKRTTPTELISAIKAQVASNHFSNGRGELFIPNPATWLNQGRWQDEIKPAITATCTQPLFDPNNRYADD